MCLKALREARWLGYWKAGYMECTGKRRGSIVSVIGEQGFEIDPSQNSKGPLNRGNII